MTPTNPLSLVAELTHRCPLHCVYCSNPLEMQAVEKELTTADWARVFQEAADMGVLHLHLTGGEPLARPDLPELIAAGRNAGLYLNMITSGLGLTQQRMDALCAAGLDHIQLSLQDADEVEANRFAGAKAHARKLEIAALIRQYKVAFTINIVVHRQNLDRLDAMLELAEQLQPHRIEVAHVQYYGWALRNREQLLPTREQVDRSIAQLAAAQKHLSGRIHLQSVLPDYYARYPKACVGGWGRQMMLIDPAGEALPCHAAGIIPGIQFDSVREHSLQWLWQESTAFNLFRGDSWMTEPCNSCERKQLDFGGCRCQALQITGDAHNADPACHLSPHHEALVRIAETAPQHPAEMLYRILA